MSKHVSGRSVSNEENIFGIYFKTSEPSKAGETFAASLHYLPIPVQSANITSDKIQVREEVVRELQIIEN